ncbi:SDR family NAD(P)-dependent oxidoreductase [Streptomyces griseoloalbus]|uniref:NAD(P)-dependent dehydrogenase (Short-subunit alcohol dehydrogenase family) n=1 Tax=Streptomyces griseoloalbus TaxID=67303 RepID=A0A7W8F8J3_9ACTN|nr:SDR family NAD(P)-dependent oxidoreductase [Streptomyces albaduncus]MBB5125165.1 NAD(P)-dependent dehydrogenase (short-subunit alcohol dehydrogenase family) [Streptomyces albaduncus]GGW29657.1 short-chain dehydrogenase [Streptomyces albaduncus]
MARIFITGSTDGLGLMAAQLLSDQGHTVALHARNDARARDAQAALPDNAGVAVGDLSSITQTREIAGQVNDIGPFDAVIHNAGVGYYGRSRVETEDGLSDVFAVNVLAPYLLTALITPPERLVYLSSGMHHSGDTELRDAQWTRRPWQGAQAYSESKFYVTTLAFAVARRWPTTLSNAVDPGWVPTKMGGNSATDDLHLAPVTQAWLAAGDDAEALVTGRYFHHQQSRRAHPATQSPQVQDRLLKYCADLTKVELPTAVSAD